MKRMMLALWTGCLLILAACGGAPEDNAAPSVVRWDRDPLNVVFRAEIVGSAEVIDEVAVLNHVPLCTIYGDGRVVWTVENSSGLTDVWFDVLNDAQITSFVTELTVNRRIYTYETGIETELPTSEQPVYEAMTLNVNDQRHQTDAFAEWPPTFFEDILEDCRTTGVTPREFLPNGGWVSAYREPYNPMAPTLNWDPIAAGVSFEQLADDVEVRWVEGRPVTALWDQIRTNSPDLQFLENGEAYAIGLQVPGVTRDAPPAPAS